MEAAGPSQTTFEESYLQLHHVSKRPHAERYCTEEDVGTSGTNFASNRSKMFEGQDSKPMIWALLAPWVLLTVIIRGLIHKLMLWISDSFTITSPSITAVKSTPLYKFLFAGRGAIITVTLGINLHLSSGESRSEGKDLAAAPVLLVVDGVLAVERITFLSFFEDKNVILSGTRFRQPPGITASQRCSYPTRFNKVPKHHSQSPNKPPLNQLLHCFSPLPSPQTIWKATQSRTKSPIHSKKRRNNEQSPNNSCVAHTISNTTTIESDTLHLTLHIPPTPTMQALALQQINMPQLSTEDMFAMFCNLEECTNDDIDSALMSQVFGPDDDIFNRFDMAQEETHVYAQDDCSRVEINNDLQFSREQRIQPAHFYTNLFHDSPSQTDIPDPVSPTHSESSSFISQQALTPQSSPTSYQDSFQDSPNSNYFLQEESDWDSTPSYIWNPDEDFPGMEIEPSLMPTPSPENLGPSPSNNDTPTPPGPYTPATPPTPNPTPQFPTDAPTVSNTKPLKRPRRPRLSNSAGITKPLRCTFAGDADAPPCNKEFVRSCDLKKHEKRHKKPYSCRFKGCKNTRGFSSEKDRERHENCLHKKECLMCTECGHETPRKDNMKDHVSRKHGKRLVDEVMRRIMAAPRTSPRPDEDGDDVLME